MLLSKGMVSSRPSVAYAYYFSLVNICVFMIVQGSKGKKKIKSRMKRDSFHQDQYLIFLCTKLSKMHAGRIKDIASAIKVRISHLVSV